MFFRKSAISKKLLQECEEWLRLAEKVFHYRRDILDEKEVESLQNAAEALGETFRERKDEAELKSRRDALEKVLRKTGGTFYPRAGIAENAEMFLVAAILAIGVRTFFLQPFKIPTNSMYPTYNGLTHEVFMTPEETPGTIGRVVRKVTLWAKRYELEAPSDGEVLIPRDSSGHHLFGFEITKAPRISVGSFSMLPTIVRKMALRVGNEDVSFHVAGDLNTDKLILDRFFPDAPSRAKPEFGIWLRRLYAESVVDVGGVQYFRTGQTVNKDETFFVFDVLTGDALFVDRFSYNFWKPDVGDPFVFRTDNIPGIGEENRGKYYIKRLVGGPGDTLEIQAPVLYRNGEPNTGADAFAYNHAEEGEYEGYSNARRLDVGFKESIPEGYYYAMGDNSDESSDSRYWGYVPEKEIVGKAVFIYYPFSKRWGPAD